MARTKQTARKSSGGKAPLKLLKCTTKSSFKQFMTGHQQATYSGAKGGKKKTVTSYLNYENVFGSFGFETGAISKNNFEPRFNAGYSVNPISKTKEIWLSMTINSKFDGSGMSVHKRPDLNLVMVVDISGSMGSLMSDTGTETKLEAAKMCLKAICDKMSNDDYYGLISFDDKVYDTCQMAKWSKFNKTTVKNKIESLNIHGMTDLSKAYKHATQVINTKGDKKLSSRIIFMTDLNSTVDSVADEKALLKSIEANSLRKIYTTVVGIGMDLNVELVEKISSVPGANYISASSGEEFIGVVGKDFNYNVTVIAFNITVELQPKSNFMQFNRGYGSPEINTLKNKSKFTLSSEFPSAKSSTGETFGGALLFKLQPIKGKIVNKLLSIAVSYTDAITGDTVHSTHSIPIIDPATDPALKKALLLTHFVDLHNDYLNDKKGVIHLERFVSFKLHFEQEMANLKDNTLATTNIAYVEMIDKIIQIEKASQKSTTTATSSTTQPFNSSFISPFSGTIFSNNNSNTTNSPFNTGLQNTTSSLFNTGLQNTTNSLFNTGLQNTTNSLFNTGIQNTTTGLFNNPASSSIFSLPSSISANNTTSSGSIFGNTSGLYGGNVTPISTGVRRSPRQKKNLPITTYPLQNTGLFCANQFSNQQTQLGGFNTASTFGNTQQSLFGGPIFTAGNTKPFQFGNTDPSPTTSENNPFNIGFGSSNLSTTLGANSLFGGLNTNLLPTLRNTNLSKISSKRSKKPKRSLKRIRFGKSVPRSLKNASKKANPTTQIKSILKKQYITPKTEIAKIIIKKKLTVAPKVKAQSVQKRNNRAKNEVSLQSAVKSEASAVIPSNKRTRQSTRAPPTKKLKIEKKTLGNNKTKKKFTLQPKMNSKKKR